MFINSSLFIENEFLKLIKIGVLEGKLMDKGLPQKFVLHQ